MTIQQALKKTTSPDAELLLAFILHEPLAFVFAHPEATLREAQRIHFERCTQRRSAGEPLAYITRTKEFYGRAFFVNHNTLIPRPETELMIDLILQRNYPPKEDVLFVDIGTGSGNIIVTLAKELSEKSSAIFCATDASDAVIRIARKNAQRHSCKNCISFHVANLLCNNIVLKRIARCQHIVIAANLPYVNAADKKSLLSKKKFSGLRYEPQEALWSAHDGLAHYQELLAQMKELVEDTPGKIIESLYEIDSAQKDYLAKMIQKDFPTAKITFHKDLAGQTRICHWVVTQ